MPVPKKWCLSLASIALLLGILWTYRNRRLFLVRDITTGQSLDYPDLRSHIYFSSMDSVAEAAAASIKSLSRWRLVFDDREKHVLLAEVEAPIGGFLSDVTITLSRLGPNHVRVIIRSSSSVGRGDLGENARYIRQIQSAMDRLLIGN